MTALKREIRNDCRKAMFLPMLLTVVREGISGILSVYIASILARFADAVLAMNITFVLQNIWILVACIGVSVIIIPLFLYINNVITLKGALFHDKLVIGRFLDKIYSKAMAIERGDAQYRLEYDPNDYRHGWMQIVSKMIVTPITFIVLTYFAFGINWLFAVCTFLISIMRLCIPLAVRKWNAKYDRETREYNTSMRANEVEITSEPHAIIMLGLEEPLIKSIDHLYENFFLTTAQKRIKYQSIANGISLSVNTLTTLLVLLLGVVMVSRDLISAGSVAAMVGYFSIYNSLFSSIGYIIRERPILNNLCERMQILYEESEPNNAETINEFSSISADNIAFRHDDKLIFENLSFTVCYGEKVAICGANGSGKSTLIKLLCGFSPEYNGNILINGKTELSDMSLYNWRHQLALVPQEPCLFDGTVLENLIFDNRENTGVALDLLEKMGASHLAEREISFQHDELSGGEKQKISIIRAILKDCPILLLDESSNHLDTQSKEWLSDFICRTDRTVISISHENEFLRTMEKKILLK